MPGIRLETDALQPVTGQLCSGQHVRKAVISRQRSNGNIQKQRAKSEWLCRRGLRHAKSSFCRSGKTVIDEVYIHMSVWAGLAASQQIKAYSHICSISDVNSVSLTVLPACDLMSPGHVKERISVTILQGGKTA